MTLSKTIPVCGECRIVMRPERNDSTLLIDGARQLYHTDCWRCPACSHRVLVGHGEPIDAYSALNFGAQVRRARAGEWHFEPDPTVEAAIARAALTARPPPLEEQETQPAAAHRLGVPS